jgi:hypothetical protein
MKVGLAFLTLSLMATFSNGSWAGDLDRFCFSRGGIDERVCAAPLAVLIARGEEFNGKMVILHGYFANGPVPMLFASNEDSLTSNVEAGLVVRIPHNGPIARKLLAGC